MEVARDLDLTVTVHHEGGQLWADVAELPGVFAAGDDMEELMESLREALELYLPADRVTITKWLSLGTQDDAERESVRVLVGAP